MTLSIIGAGLGRTGTASLKVALEKLGFGKCHHMSEVFGSPEQIALWSAAAAGKPDWAAIFTGYGSAVDFPSAAYWRELAAFYPNAKIILSLREPGTWADSTQETILSPAFSPAMAKMPFGPVLTGVVWRFFDGRIHDRDHLLGVFNRHNDAVRAAFAKDRLLVFEAKEGWAPLCAFLGVPVPAEEFPRVNSKEEMKPMMAAIAAQFAGGVKGAALDALNERVRETIHGGRENG